MSKSKSVLSTPEDVSSKNHSVLDFLYHDSRRVGSFLSQFDPGLLRDLTRTNEAASENEESSGRDHKLNAAVMSGTARSGEANRVGTRDSIQSAYDPYWANARSLLNYLSENDLIQRDVTIAAMGQFVLARGSLIVTDLQMMKAMWKSDVMRRFVKASVEATQQNDTGAVAVAQRSAKAKREIAANQPPSETDLVLELLPHFPHSSQFHLIAEDTPIWATIEQGAMVGSTADLMLKHGAKVAGEWSMLGILDGRPWEAGDMLSTMETILVTGAGNSVTNIPLNLAPHIRQALGRPLLSYSMTPLLVFREVA